jgi:integrase
MAVVKYYIRDPKATNKSTVMLSFTYAGNRIRISTREQIYPSHWNSRSEQVREVVDEPKALDINNRLNELATLVTGIHQEFNRNGIIPEPKEFMQEIENRRRTPKLQNNNKSLWDYFEDFIVFKQKTSKDIRDYNNSLRKHLMAAEKIWGKQLTFTSIKLNDNGFIEVMEKYLTFEALNPNGEKGLATNTVGKQFKNLKVFLSWCFRNEFAKGFDISHIKTKTEDVDNVYLKQEEVDAIYNLKDLKEEEALIRDLFIIGVETGLRYSDFTRIKPHHISEGKLSVNPIKTEGKKNNRVTIPLSDKFKGILERRNGIPPNYNGELTKFNKMIRKLAERSGITSKIVIVRSVSGKTKEEVIEKYNLLSSHTCRRTFCTLKFLSGMPAQAIMVFSGHKTERSFLRYLKLNNEIVIETYKHFF